ncbi:VanW family protein [Pseudalkalibacillus hwajinpoensis]|uniref:VanW family protein n=1 Tax=Guptibacillus hwajinpoensis TaxID=208199 RepID=UPI001CFDAFC1|nr:VanW family protein [Pseudalkalibacillus hwajinpoensis]
MFSLLLALSLAYSVGEEQIIIVHDRNRPLNVEKQELFSEGIGKPFYDEEELNDLLERVDASISNPPQNAFIDQHGSIREGVSGYRLKREKFQTKILETLYQKGTTWVEPDVVIQYPRVNAELLASIRRKEVGAFVTHFRKSNVERTSNIVLAADAINNTVVFPGETFSFNQTVGKRTKERGYLPAPIIVKGELSEGIGGGICQVSSTLFNAVDLAGVQILERYSHSRSVPYVKPGRDATVSWYGPDFSFRNDHHQPLLISAKVLEGSVVIRIYSSEENQ